MKVARSPDELAWARRAVALGTFDGIHAGHRRVIDAAVATGLRTAVVTFHPHPRSALGEHVELISTLERRLELFAESGVDDVLVLHFTQALARVEPEQFALDVLDPIGAEIVVAGTNFRFGLDRRGDLELLSGLGYCGRPVPLVEGVSSSAIRKLVGAGEVERAAPLLGRPVEVEGVVVRGDARGNTLGYPTANLDVEPDVLVPAFGIYAGAVGATRAAVSIGTNPQYDGKERRIEAFLLDWDGDLYGRRLVVELWRRLRDEQAFGSERELVEQIARDVEDTRAASRPVEPA